MELMSIISNNDNIDIITCCNVLLMIYFKWSYYKEVGYSCEGINTLVDIMAKMTLVKILLETNP